MKRSKTLALVGLVVLLAGCFVTAALYRFLSGEFVIVNQTDGELTDIELMGDDGSTVVVDRLAPGATIRRFIGWGGGEGRIVSFSDAEGRWRTKEGLYTDIATDVDVDFGPGRSVSGVPTVRVK